MAPGLVTALVLEDPAITDWDRAPANFIADQERLLDAYAADGGESQREQLRRDSTWSEDEINACADCKPMVDRSLVSELRMGKMDRVSALNSLRFRPSWSRPAGRRSRLNPR